MRRKGKNNLIRLLGHLPRLLRLSFGLAAIGALYMLFEAQWLRLKKKRLELPGLPRSLAGLRLLHVSDLHAGVRGPNNRAIAKFVQAARLAKPDLVLFTGDMTDKKKDLSPHLDLLSEVTAPLGKLAVLGNHDHGLRKRVIEDFFNRLAGRSRISSKGVTQADVEKTVSLNRSLLSRAGIRLLENECAVIESKGGPIQICGIDEFQYGLADLDATASQIEQGVPLRILLSHSPDVVSLLEEGQYHLVLSGHTHGGQICIPHPSRGRILLSASGSDYTEGLYRFPNVTLHVSRGVGTTLVPMRLLSRPEITLLELYPA